MDLKEACDSTLADPSLAAHDGKTFCNFGARRIAQAKGCHEFDDLGTTAEIMGQIMTKNASGRWEPATGSEATSRAIAGGLAFAFMSAEMLGEAHAHIAAVAPVPMQMSGSLGRAVPIVANIGKTNGLMRVSQAFPILKGEPAYFIFT